MKKKLTALLLAGALLAGLCGFPVLAAGETGQDAAPSQPPVEAAGETQPVRESDPAGVLSFENLEARLRENNLDLLVLEENIAVIEALDYDELREDMIENLNQLADMEWLLGSVGQSYAAASVKSNYTALKESFDDLRQGKLQSDNADLVRQLRNAQDQIVMVAQSLYTQYLSMQRSDQSLDRSLAALDRNIRVAELSYEQGNLSALSLQQAKTGRAELVSGRQSLSMGMEVMAMQLESLVGAELTGQLRLTDLPVVTDEELDAMDEQDDLDSAKQASYALLSAQRTLDDARETYQDALDKYGRNSTGYQLTQAKHTWQAAQLTHQSTVRNFEMSFRTLYRQVKDDKQVLEAAKVSLEFQRRSYAADKLKYEQGRISQNALLDAADQISAAEEKVESAALDLFVAYNNYRWAVDHGILN